MKNYLLLTLLFCFAVAFSSCSDDDDDQPLTTEQMLMGGRQWQVTAATSTSVGTTTDIYAGLPSCQKDNFLEFRNNQVLIVDEGPTKCDPSASQQRTDTWNLTDRTLTLRASAFGVPLNGTFDFTIEEISTNNLVLSFNNSSLFPMTGRITLRAK